MLARTLAVVGVVGGAVWAVSKYLKSQNGTSVLAAAGEGDKSLAPSAPQNGSGRQANAPANGSRGQAAPSH